MSVWFLSWIRRWAPTPREGGTRRRNTTEAQGQRRSVQPAPRPGKHREKTQTQEEKEEEEGRERETQACWGCNSGNVCWFAIHVLLCTGLFFPRDFSPFCPDLHLTKLVCICLWIVKRKLCPVLNQATNNGNERGENMTVANNSQYAVYLFCRYTKNC